MGYRSDVGAVFYVTTPYDLETKKSLPEAKAKAKALLDLWWQGHMQDCPEGMKAKFSPVPDGYKFCAEDVKWYDSYPDVMWFTNLMQCFNEELVDNEELDGGSGLHRAFACEFARIGEDLEDNVYEASGYGDCRLSISCALQFD